MPTIESCPLCDNMALIATYAAEDQPANENVLYTTREAARSAPRGSMRVAFCPDCGLAFNQEFDEARLDYSEEYQYTQPSSPRFNSFIEGIAAELVDEYGIRNGFVLEIGCGKGTFLRLVCGVGGSRGLGFDTCYEGPLTLPDERIAFQRSYFTAQQMHEVPDLITCRQVLEHIIAPRPFLKEVRGALPTGASTVLYFELPDFEWIVKNRSVWDFYYEHCSYYCALSLRNAFLLSGFQVIRQENVFAGQYLRLDARVAEVGADTLIERPTAAFVSEVSEFARVVADGVRNVEASVDLLDRRGPWAIWGAAAKGVTFSNLSERVRRANAFGIDINPLRQGKYLPVSGWPVVSPDGARERVPRTIVVMNPIYIDEIAASVRALGLGSEVILVDQMFSGVL